MNLSDALGGSGSGPWGNNGGGNQPSGPWPQGGNQPSGPWPQGGGGNQPSGPWPQGGGGNQPSGPWPQGGGSNQPSGPWPQSGGGNQPSGPWGPGGPPGPSGPSGPSPPSGPSAPNPIWPGGNSSGDSGWPGPPSGPGPAPGPGQAVAPQQNLTVPFSQPLPNGVYDKLLITIAGTIKPHPNKITVDLYAGKDLAFHCNPRFNEGGKKVIVRNHRVGNTWGREERESSTFPFSPGQPFEMKILSTNQEYRVAVNNNHLLEFKHRVTDLRSIKTLNVYGDLTLSKVVLEHLP